MTADALMKMFSDWAKKVFTPSYQQEVENYLAEAVDIFDLERRIRLIQKRGML
jgi:hypothetical protein